MLARPAAPGVVRAADQPSPATARRVYPYSIVPGGLQGRAELVQVVKDDKVVAAHYAGFAVHKARLRSVDKPRAVYVSYRKGEQVYWTSKKMMLAAGETLLSDGQHDIRARCGNRIADTPQLPVEAGGPARRNSTPRSNRPTARCARSPTIRKPTPARAASLRCNPLRTAPAC